ncbi:YwqG family protein [uncultured Ruminococcus sp.]|uniref:YwqG family protein n=1 Tax=uncultured Ruminococcus sp. TaxID=165186 RepID=UPI0025EB1D95|nr:YwqG family protein [uncultured Ruminococcus sp.]
MGLLDLFKRKDKDRVPKEVEASEKTDSGANMVKEIREEILQKTAIPCMKLELTDTKPGLFDSKVGGVGYVPHDAKIPEDSEGVQLRLLAQIDCAEITLEDFPHQGLLQFWILNDDVSGLNFDDNTLQDTFRVLYFKEPDRTVTEKEVREKMQDMSSDEEDYFPVRGCYGLAFSAGMDTISSSDYRFENCIKKLVRQDYPEKAESLLENIDDFIDEDGEDWGGGHKIGGYPGFTQWDPRSSEDTHDVLLFQLDSDMGADWKILWGDCGIGNFFINREKLKNCDFSDVLYTWDCC